MTGWSAPASFEERLAEAGVIVLVVLLAAGTLVWAAGELGGLLAHGAWPAMSISDAPAVAAGLLQHPGDPAVGWPPAARRAAPPPWLYYALHGMLLCGVLAVALTMASRAFSASSNLGAAGRIPRAMRQLPSIWRQQRPFLGWSGTSPLSAMLLGGAEDSVAAIGPPWVGKTQGVLIPPSPALGRCSSPP